MEFLKCEGGIYVNAAKIEAMIVDEYDNDLFFIDIYTHNHPDDKDCELKSEVVPLKGTYYRWYKPFSTRKEAEEALDFIITNLSNF